MLLLAVGQLLFSTVMLLIALFLIVLIHELGHFSVARWFGVKVDTFSIGFGREIYGWDDSKGTHWRIAMIPLGGYVKFAGDANAASFPDAATLAKAKATPDHFHGKPIWQRMLVILAGPVANFILAIVIFAGVYMVVGRPYVEPRIGYVEAGSAAAQSGLQVGDLITSINGSLIKNFPEVAAATVGSAERPLNLTVTRQGQSLALTVTPLLVVEKDGFGGTLKLGRLGIKASAQPSDVVFDKLSLPQALAEGAATCWGIIKSTFSFIGDLFTGRQETKQIGSFVSMGKIVGDAANEGLTSYLMRIAFLSVSIGLLNLFPIPVLDGGHLVFYTLELLKGKPLSPQTMEWGFRVGLFIILILMSFALMNDLTRSINVIRGG